MKEYFSIKQATDYLGVSVTALRKNLDYEGGTIATFRMGRRVIIPKQSLIDFISGGGSDE
tara:strand:- start:453 stop:632 length:180 start_codon:yes stop_codon:yes gene_type:complete